MSERLRILKLLEERKINAEEAARLLEALSHSEIRDKKKKYKIWSSIENIPEIIASAINFKNIVSKETLQFSQKEKIEFKGISGDLEIIGNTTNTIDIEKDGFAKIKEKENMLEIKAISGDLKITVPNNTDLTIKGVAGDIKISHLNSKIEIASVSGDITGEELSGSFIGDFVSGDVDLDYQQVEEIQIKSKNGDIVLKLDENVETEIVTETKNGDIDCEFELKDEERNENKITGIINRAKAKVVIRNEHGNIVIKKRRLEDSEKYNA